MKPSTSMHQRFRAIREAEAGANVASTVSDSLDQELIDLIRAPLERGETAVAGHDRKERELADRLSRLSVVESWSLHRRLANPQRDDALATAFARLVAERRARLLTFLAGARRRAAITSSQ